MMIYRAKGHGGPRVYYDRTRGGRFYHVFSLSRRVMKGGGSYWRLVIGQYSIVFGWKA